MGLHPSTQEYRMHQRRTFHPRLSISPATNLCFRVSVLVLLALPSPLFVV
jgi:hypothetical protein